MNNTRRIQIFDSTLRDGAQSEGIAFSVEDKLALCATLDAFGVSYIEAGNPGSNPKDAEFFARTDELNLKHAQLVAFGATRRKNVRAEEDANIASLLAANTKVVSVFGKSWDLHVEHILGTTPAENLAMIRDTVAYLVSLERTVFYDAEHFFDGYRANPDYALATLRAAAEGGAAALILCDTNGGTFPSEIKTVTARVADEFDVSIGIHAHNDCGMAIACSVAAVEAGATQVQGTFIGYGERCGNANLSAIIPALTLHAGRECVPAGNLPLLTDTAKRVAEISNIGLGRYLPFVGASAFTHKAGMHADGVLKVSKSFEHVDPSAVGNTRKFVMSEVAGRTAIAEKLKRFFPALTKDSPEIKRIADRIKKLENEGYTFESAEHSLALEVCRILGTYRPYFELISYETTTLCPSVDPSLSAKAVVKVRVRDKTHLLVAEGDGPVHALDLALRQCLEVFYPVLHKVGLIDYKVRVLDSNATGSHVRVLIGSTDGYRVWTTIGVSTDLIRASFKALTDSAEYYLMLTDGLIGG